MPRNARIQITEKDQVVLARLARPCTAEMLQEFYSTQQGLYRRLKQYRNAGVTFNLGSIPNGKDTGRTEDVFCTSKWKTNSLAHDVATHRLLLAWGLPFECGDRHVDQDILPDGTVAGVIQVEHDTGSIPLPRVEERLRRAYEDEIKPIVFVTAYEGRLQRVLSRCGFLSGRLVGCTYASALNKPAQVVLRHCDGDEIALDELLEIALEKALHDQHVHGADRQS